MNINTHLASLPGSYLFAEIANRVQAYTAAHPQNKVLRLGIGDVTLPLAPHVAQAFGQAARDMGTAAGFHGYPPGDGYEFLIDAIIQKDYAARGVALDRDEVFISDGAKTDASAIQELFAPDAVIALTDPVYPVYVDANAMAGRLGVYQDGQWSKAVYLPTVKENGFVPPLPQGHVDVIYLCYPNNPTGTVLTKAQLKPFVDYAREHEAVIIYDAAYKAFISSPDIPRSIYEIEGAEEVAIELNSFSKTAGFTGVRCAYTVVPKALKGSDGKGQKHSFNALWRRRTGSKNNGVSYPVQVAAAASLSEEGIRQTRQNIAYYMENAALIKNGLTKAGLTVFGGEHAPYIWFETPGRVPSWTFFDTLLHQAQVVGTPGAGFGKAGEHYFRLTAFSSRETTLEAVERMITTF